MSVRQLLAIVSFALVLLTSCKNNSGNSEQPVVSVDSVKPPVVQNALPEPDTLHYDTLFFPKESNLSAELLQCYTYHPDEVEPNTLKQNWWGLFKNQEGYYLARTAINAERIYDGIFDDDGIDAVFQDSTEIKRTGWNISTNNKDTNFLLITEIPCFKERKVPSTLLNGNYIFPGDTLSFNFLGIYYQIFFTRGTKINKGEKINWNYKLYLKSNRRENPLTELLVSSPHLTDHLAFILFAGDIDGDGLLDLVIDTAMHDNAEVPTLYLSKPSKVDHLLEVIALHVSIGC